MIARLPTAPLRSMERLSKLMEDLFPEPDEVWKGWCPTVDIKDTDKEMIFMVDLPGVDEKDIVVELVGDVLAIRGSRERKEEERREDYVRMEREYGTFQRTFTLNFAAKPEEIVAEHRDGVLKVCVPKAEPAHTHRIKVLANGKH